MSSFDDGLKRGAVQLGLCVMYPSPGAVERIGGDWDWIWIDGQHGQLGYQDTLALVRACSLIQRPAFVRVPWLEAGHIGLALDMGAQGIIVPCVDTPEQARKAVDAAKFPPLGKRSYGGRRPIDLQGRLYSNTANEEVRLILQLETPEALDNAERIAAIPGVDGLFLGPDDIMLRRGYAMDAPRNPESLGKDMETVMQACRRHGKIGVMVGMGPDIMGLCVSLGFQMIVGGGDVAFLATTSKQAAATSRAAIQNAKPAAKAAAGKAASLY